MKLETFFDKFDQITNNQAAIDKVRELIMSSAFCGSFSKEERSLALPKEWSAEEKPELPNIPSSWKWEKGCDVFEVIRGLSYQKNDSRDSATEGFSPVLRANNIGKSINFSDLVYVRTEKIRDVQLVRRNDILIAMSSGSKRLVGKAAPIVTDFKGSFGAFCGIIRNKSGIQNEFLARYFQSPQYTSWVVAAGRGIGINNLRREDLDSIPIPAPPAEVQISIVAKVDELMALCDRLEAQLKERDVKQATLAKAALAKFTEDPSPENLQLLFHPSFSIEPEDLRMLVLNLAIKGKLVAQDPKDESAEHLFEKILTHKSGAKKTRAVSEVFGKPKNKEKDNRPIPDGWIWTSFGEIVVNRDGERIPVSKEIRETKAKVYDYYGASGVIDKIDSYLFSSPLLLIGEDGANLINRSTPIAFIARGHYWVNNHAHVLDGISEDFLKYLEIYINAINLEAYVTGSAQPKMNQAKLNSIPVALPPMDEQKRIIAKVHELFELLSSLEAQLDASRKTGEKLLEAMVSELTSA